MLEIKVTIAIPGLPEAINNLAQAMANAGTVRTENPVAAPAAVAAPEAAVLPDTGNGLAGTESAAEAATAPAQTAVESTPAASTSATVQTSTPAPVHAPTPILDPIPAPAPTPAEPAKAEPATPAQDTAGTKTYTREEIARAGSALVTLGKMQELLALLQRYGVASVAQLSPEQYGAFAADLIALGASL